MAVQADHRQSEVRVPFRAAGPATAAPGANYPHRRHRARVAAVVLPVEQRARTSRCWRWRPQARLREPAVLEREVRRMLADRRSDGADGQLRVPVAAAAERQGGGSGRRAVPELHAQPRPVDDAGDQAPLRQHACARTAASSTCSPPTTRSSTKCWRSTTAFPNVAGSAVPPRAGRRSRIAAACSATAACSPSRHWRRGPRR